MSAADILRAVEEARLKAEREDPAYRPPLTMEQLQANKAGAAPKADATAAVSSTPETPAVAATGAEESQPTAAEDDPLAEALYAAAPKAPQAVIDALPKSRGKRK